MMINPSEAKTITKATGVNTRKIAELTNIRYGYLSEWFCGKRLLDASAMARLDSYFGKLKTIM